MRIPNQTFFKLADNQRVLVWFSCGAASAVAASLALKKYGQRVEVIYCDTSKDEHEDNQRFMAECEQWLGVKIKRLKSDLYSTVDEVNEGTRYISGPKGARCTTELKKVPRLAYQWPDDIHVFGFTADESAPLASRADDRVADFEMNNPELFLDWVLVDSNTTKQDCYAAILKAGIKLPEMYLLGYRNNNCKGCVKATSPGYWNKVRVDFPETFKVRAERSRALGVRLVKLKGERIFLDELPEGVGKYRHENISCGPECGTTNTK